MPPALPLTHAERRDLLAVAILSLVLAAGIVAPKVLMCKYGGDDWECHVSLRGELRRWVFQSVWIFCQWLLALLSQRWLPEAEAQRPLGLGLQILGLTLLTPAIGALLGQTDGSLLPRNPYDLQIHACFATVACLSLEYRRRRRRGEADADSLRHDALAQSRRLDQARMALLQAQVEPHFLFNTLAHLRLLARKDTHAARAMLADLRLYLAAALPELRQTEVPLARELELVRAFLALHQRRIGTDRLTLNFDVTPGYEDAIVPSTCLLTLAENAIKHGVTPQVEGGVITVRAGPDPERAGLLRLEVADTGVGMVAGAGGGTGLVTLQARMAALHGDKAKLSLLINQPHGLIARVQVPWPA